VNHLTRQQWNARTPSSRVRLPWANIIEIAVHYTAMDADRTGDPRARMRAIQAFHMNERGWADIAYNWAFTHAGVILQGRGWETRSAATGNANGHTVAFVFLGTDVVNRDDVTGAGRRALTTLILEAERLAGKKLVVKGHRDYMNTACPGDELMAFIRSRAWEQTPASGFVTPEQARAWWQPGKPVSEMLPGPRPKPRWFWDADTELNRRRRAQRQA
jgi:hypothetical protein